MYKSDSWRAVVQASRNLRNLPNQLAREAELEELRSTRRDLEAADFRHDHVSEKHLLR